MENPTGEIIGFFNEVKIIYTTRCSKNEDEEMEIIFFYGKTTTLCWDSDRWHWKDSSHFLNYTSKIGKDSIINRNPRTIRAADKWQGYLSGTYRFYWSQLWDPLRAGKESDFMWFIWHKVVTVNEWRTRIAQVSISKQCSFCLPNTNGFIKHKFWNCIQARRAQRWATFIMYELCGV